MSRVLSAIIAVFVLLIPQIYAALNVPGGQFLLGIGDFYLATPEGDGEGAPVRLTPDPDAATLWTVFGADVDGQYYIFHATSGLSLNYDHALPNTELKLKDDQEHRWMVVELDNGEIEIQTIERFKGHHLVIGLLPNDVYPPLVGLVIPRDSRNSLKLSSLDHRLLDEPKREPHVPLHDGDYQVLLDGLYLTAKVGPGSSPAVRLEADSEGDASLWTMTTENAVPDQVVVLRNVQSKLYLGYKDAHPGAILHTQQEPKRWTLAQLQVGKELTMREIRTCSPDQPLVADTLSFTDPPKVALHVLDNHYHPVWDFRASQPRHDSQPAQHRFSYQK